MLGMFEPLPQIPSLARGDDPIPRSRGAKDLAELDQGVGVVRSGGPPKGLPVCHILGQGGVTEGIAPFQNIANLPSLFKYPGPSPPAHADDGSVMGLAGQQIHRLLLQEAFQQLPTLVFHAFEGRTTRPAPMTPPPVRIAKIKMDHSVSGHHAGSVKIPFDDLR